jgi:RNA polymerase sigma factor (sigma-70 family)
VTPISQRSGASRVIAPDLRARRLCPDLVRATGACAGPHRRMTAPYLRELHVHCYRILGSVEDAEEALQDSLLSAWQGLPAFEGRASLQTWLYWIATNRCLDLVRSARRRPVTEHPKLDFSPPEPTRLGELAWSSRIPTCCSTRSKALSPVPTPGTTPSRACPWPSSPPCSTSHGSSAPFSFFVTFLTSKPVRWPRSSPRPSTPSPARSSEHVQRCGIAPNCRWRTRHPPDPGSPEEEAPAGRLALARTRPVTSTASSPC